METTTQQENSPRQLVPTREIIDENREIEKQYQQLVEKVNR